MKTTPQQGSRIGVVVRDSYTDSGGLGDFCDIWFGMYVAGQPFLEQLIIRGDWTIMETPEGV